MHRGKERKVLRISSRRKPYERDERQPNVQCRFHQLPQELVTDILSSLCFKTIGICRCVCKPLVLLISTIQNLSTLDNVGILSQPNNWKFTYIKQQECASSDDVELTFENVFRDRFPDTRKQIDTGNLRLMNMKPLLINSCNDFILLQEIKRTGNTASLFNWCGKTLYVCNPVSGEFITISLPTQVFSANYIHSRLVALGFSAVTNEYKVLRMRRSGYDTDQAEMYTIGSKGVWRSIGKAPNAPPLVLPVNSYLHGALHWQPDYNYLCECMHSFDFEKEEFQKLPLPRCTIRRKWRLGVLQGRLFLGVIPDQDNRNQCDIWVMKDYGVRESWTKDFAIKNLIRPLEMMGEEYRPRTGYELLVFLSNGDILISYCNELLIYYNQVTEESQEIEEKWISAIAYHPSFVSLRTVSYGAKVERIRGSEMYDKLCAESYDDDSTGFEVGLGLQSLPQEKREQVVHIIRKRNGHLKQNGDEIELKRQAPIDEQQQQ